MTDNSHSMEIDEFLKTNRIPNQHHKSTLQIVNSKISPAAGKKDSNKEQHAEQESSDVKLLPLG